MSSFDIIHVLVARVVTHTSYLRNALFQVPAQFCFSNRVINALTM